MRDFQYYLVPRSFRLLSVSDILLYAVRQAPKPAAIFRKNAVSSICATTLDSFVHVIVR